LNVRHSSYKLECDIERTGSLQEAAAEHLTAVFLEAEERRQAMPDAKWDRIYRPRIGDLRSSLDWALAKPGRRHIAIALFGAGARLFERLSLLPEGRQYADRIVDLIDEDTDPAAEALFRRQAGILWREVDRLKALALFQRSAELYRTLSDGRYFGDVLALLGGTYLYLGRHDEARSALEEAETKLKDGAQKKALWNARNDLGTLAHLTNRHIDARRYFSSARELAKSLKDPLREGIVILNLGDVEFAEGALDRAIIRAEEAVTLLSSALPSYRLRPLVNLATYYALAGDLRRSRINAEAALALARTEGGYWLRLCLQVFALHFARIGIYADAARLIGFVDRQFARSGDAKQRQEQQVRDVLFSALREHLSQDSVSIWSDEGAQWAESQAVEQVNNNLSRAQDLAAD
jgi:tetratricopeptide (TPR) repeat protein